MSNDNRPVVARKMKISRSLATNQPLPALDWPNVVRTISELQQWYIQSGDDNNAEATVAICLLLEALDEQTPHTTLTEKMLDLIGKLAYSWTTTRELPPSLRRRVQMVLTAAIDDLEGFEASVNLMIDAEGLAPN